MTAIEITMDIPEVPDKVVIRVPHNLGHDAYTFVLKSYVREFDD